MPKNHPTPDDRDDDRVSLYPLDPLEALRAALQVDPNSEPVEDPPEDTGPST
ncbi:MAG TPA: hypothetical protein VK988_10955 [Acidimicrobiales bacterium]|nr:hypothetical protein [Acidimicrobiales bacterium]